MIVTISYEPSTSSNRISEHHIGLNFVADWERIGNQPWERYDEVVNQIRPTTIRYPGGVTSEQGFDILRPNSSILLFSDGSTRQTMGAYDFANYARSEGIQSIYIIPTLQLLTSNRNSSGLRTFRGELTSAVHNFVTGVMTATQGTVYAFELGNEYESFMTAREYGSLANQLIPIIRSAIDQYRLNHGASIDSPKIALQVWSQTANPNSTISSAELSSRASNALNEITAQNKASIDILVTHWYARDRDLSFRDAFARLENDIRDSIGVVNHAQSLMGRSTSVMVSEWNANHHSEAFFGLAQIPVIMKTLVEFVQLGVGSASLWSAQYQATSIALPNGQLTPVGVTFQYIAQNLMGKLPADLRLNDSDLVGFSFTGVAEQTLALSNTSMETRRLILSSSDIAERYSVRQAVAVYGNLSEADGVYRSYNIGSPINEPDISGTTAITAPYWHRVTGLVLDFLPFQTIFVELVERLQYVGTASANRFISNGLPSRYDGAAGFDVLSFENSTAPVEVNMQIGSAISRDANHIDDIFNSIEGIVGSAYDDLIVGSDRPDTIWGNSGRNEIRGGDGNDTIFSGSGYDTISGGNGNDSIYVGSAGGEVRGDGGNDVFFVSRAGAFLDGGSGVDTLNLSELQGSKTVHFDLGVAEVDDGLILNFSNFERLVDNGPSPTRLIVDSLLRDATLGHGDDNVFLFANSSVSLDTGSGNDTVFSLSRSSAINMGDGDDYFFSFSGSANRVTLGRGNDLLISHGSDIVHFALSDGDDRWIGFDPGVDQLVFDDRATAELGAGRFSLSRVSEGSILDFHNGGSIIFIGVETNQLENYLGNLY